MAVGMSVFRQTDNNKGSMIKSGALGELAAMKHFLQLGYEVYSPISDNATYDFLVEKDGAILRIETKATGSKARGSLTKYEVQLKSVRPNRSGNVIKLFDKTKVDFLAIYIEPEDRVVIMKASDVNNTTSIRVA